MAQEKSRKHIGTHLWISNHPKTKKITIEVPVYDQWKDTQNDEWVGKSCAICSLKTMLVFKDFRNSDLKIIDLVKEGLDMDGYLESVGWKHQVLVRIAKNHGVNLKFQKQFFAGKNKIIGLGFINSNLLKGWPVMASVVNKSKNGGHVVVICGFESRGKTIKHYFILDPDSRGRNRYSLSVSDFLDVWRGGLLWFV